MKQPGLILVGGGGHCKACIDVIEKAGTYKIYGILDVVAKAETRILGYPVIGSDENIGEYVSGRFHFLVTIGQVKNFFLRKRLFEKIQNLQGFFATIISTGAYVSKHASLGKGTIIMHGACVGPEAQIGDNCIINNLANIDHEAIIGDHCHVSTGTIINGACRTGNGVMIGSRAVLLQGISIADNVVIGAGSVVLKSITESGIYAGNPMRKLS